MESLDGLLMRFGAGYVTLVLLSTAVIITVLWLRARRKLGLMTVLLAEKEAELEQKGKDRDQVLIATQSQVSKLKERIHELSRHAYISRFEPDHAYALAAKVEAEIDGKRSCFGLVRQDDRTLVPFVTQGGLEDLEVGDRFSLVGGRLREIGPVASGVRKEDSQVPSHASHALHAPHASDHVPPRASSHAPSRVSARAPIDPLEERTVANFPEEEAHATIMVPHGGASFDSEDYFRGLPCLKVIEGKNPGVRFFLPFTQGKIGRDQSNTVALDDERSSRTHAFIDYRDHGFVLRDNHSTNGTFHNGNQVEEAGLNFGDVVTIGDTRMVFTSEGYELREKSPEKAIALFEKCLSVEPSFIIGLKYLAFLLERDVRRKGESDPIYAKLKRLEKGS